MTETEPNKTIMIRAEVRDNNDGTETVEHSEVVSVTETTELTQLLTQWREQANKYYSEDADISGDEREVYERLANELEGVINSSVAIDPENVPARLRAAMYEVNDCWEYTNSERVKAHIDDAIRHLKAAKEIENDD